MPAQREGCREAVEQGGVVRRVALRRAIDVQEPDDLAAEEHGRDRHRAQLVPDHAARLAEDPVLDGVLHGDRPLSLRRELEHRA